MQISRRERILIFVALYVIISFAFIWFFYLPQSEEMETLKSNNQALTLEKQKLAALHRKQQQEKASLESPQVQDLKARVPEETELIPLLKFIDQTTIDCNIPFISVGYQADKGDKNAPAEVRIVTMDVGTTGNIYDLVEFLRRIKGAPRLMAVEDIRFQAVKLDTGVSSAPAPQVESGPPAYYIPPPDVPEAKLERIRFIIEEKETQSAPAVSRNATQAESIAAGQYTMNFTVVAYYSPKGSSNSGGATQTPAAQPGSAKTQPESGGAKPQQSTGGRV